MAIEDDYRRTIHHLLDQGYNLKKLLKYLKLVIKEEEED